MMIHQAISKLQQKKSDEARVTGQLANVHTVNGFFMVSGAGEATAAVNFPVKFIERPHMSFGGELDPSAAVTSGSFPTISVIVGSWLIEGPPTKRNFVGANLLVVTTGPATQKIWVHWTAVAKATTNPFN